MNSPKAPCRPCRTTLRLETVAPSRGRSGSAPRCRSSAGVALLLGGTLESSSAELGVYLLVLSPVAWALGLLFGIIARASGQRAQGNAMMLGALAGAVVGFSLCSGAALLGGSF